MLSISAYPDDLQNNTQDNSSQFSASEKQKLEKLFLGSQTAKLSQENIQAKPLSVTTSSANENDKNNEQNIVNQKEELSGTDLSVTLIRYAWQQLFAPEKILSSNNDITRTPMHTQYFVNNLIYGDKVYSHPLASWELNNTYVTAIEIRNKYQHDTLIHLNHDICGEWLSASIYPSESLKESGNKQKDSAVLFLLSDKSFSDAMRVCNGLA